MLVDATFLKNSGIDIQNINQDKKFEKEIQNILFLIQPTSENMKKAIALIKSSKNQPQYIEKPIFLIFYPKRTALAKQILEISKIQEDTHIEIQDFNFDLIPITQDVLSLELNSSFKELYIDQQLNMCNHMAESIQRIQLIYGKIPNIFAKGDNAGIVRDILNLQKDLKLVDEDKSSIETLFIFDRQVDLLPSLV